MSNTSNPGWPHQLFSVVAILALVGSIGGAYAAPMPTPPDAVRQNASPPDRHGIPNPRPAVDGVLAAFETHPLVGMGEHHALAQEGDFYVDLVSDPRFAERVGNVVVEFGSAAHQDTIDRYLAGKDVPYPELRRVWTDLVAAYPAMVWTMYVDFFAQVRRVNQGLSPEKRIKVWLGDPALDWSSIKTAEDLKPYQARRDALAAELIDREILERGKKALVIYGYPHFQDFDLTQNGVQPSDYLWALTERKHPGAFFVVRAYVGLPDKTCSARLERRIRDWPTQSLVSPVKGTWLDEAMHGPQCAGLPSVLHPPGTPEPVFSAETLAHMQSAVRNVPLDALLYLGPEATLTRSPITPDSYLDVAYFQELSRRSELLLGAPLSWREWTARAAKGVQPYDVK